MITTTLKEIRAHKPCEDGWKALLQHLGKSGAEAKNWTEPLPILAVLDSNGPDDALWVFDRCADPFLRRLLAADYAERVLPNFESLYPNDNRPRRAIEVARDPNATAEDLAIAMKAAWAAALEALEALDAVDAVDAARAARAATWAAGACAAKAAEWATLVAVDPLQEYAAQESRLRQYLTHGEAAKDMPWPDMEVAQ